MYFEIDYIDGSNVTEKQISWQNCGKRNVKSISIVDNNNIKHTLTIPSICFGIFQHKVKYATLGHNGVSPSLSEKIPELKGAQEIGCILNLAGDCLVMSVKEHDSSVHVSHSNVNQMGLNLKLHDINLGDI